MTATLMAAFQSLDIDDAHAGTIGMEDLESILGKHFEMNHAKDILKEFLEKANVSKDERIDFTEFVHHMRDTHSEKMQPRQKRHFRISFSH